MYSDLSKELTKKLSKKEKKDNGIFFTPPNFIRENLGLLPLTELSRVLEPSCGSGEYISALSEFPNLQITGIEKNKTICSSPDFTHISKMAEILNMDFLEYSAEPFDLIIGNPPYFTMKKTDVAKRYHEFFDGRPNIFILFIIKAMDLLRADGYLSFVLPANFLNCLYYEKTRKYLAQFRILNIIECKDKYLETDQETILLIVQKTPSTQSYNIKGYTIFTKEENRDLLRKLYENSTTLKDMGFRVKVGTVVWNECKKILTNDKTKTRLIYSSDIDDHALGMKTYKNSEKKNYIKKEGVREPTLVINRGYGKGLYHFDYCLILGDEPYLIENHLICIEFKEEVTRNELLALYEKIMASFDDQRTKDFIKIYFGNNAINTTELNNIFPIYL
jgi:adenine-specific DNA-methyltransferase